MNKPKKIYISNKSSAYAQIKIECLQRDEYISVEQLKLWIAGNTHHWEHSGVDIIKPDELLKYLES